MSHTRNELTDSGEDFKKIQIFHRNKIAGKLLSQYNEPF